MKVKIKLIEDGKAPFKKHEDDACFDLFAREINEINTHLIEVKLGVSIEPPEGYRVALYPRSSISKTGWMLANSVGVGDNNYRGEYKAYFNRVNVQLEYDRPYGMIYMDPPFPYEVGDRCIQFEIVPYYKPEIEIVDNLTDTARGDGGFGSTGGDRDRK